MISSSINARTQTLPVKSTLLVVSTLTVMAGATIAPSLPAMQEYFADVNDVEYLVRLALTAPALCIAIGAPVAGIAIDALGRKPILLLALAVYGLAGGSGVVLDSLGFILVGRAFLGFSVAAIMTTAVALIADYYSGETRAQFLGLQAAFMGFGGVVFLTVGGFLADINWRLPFLIYFVAWVLLPCVWVLLPEPQPEIEEPEVVGSPETSMPITPQETPYLLVGLTYGIALLTQVVFYLVPVQLPFYLRELVGANASLSGMAIALTTLCMAIASMNYRRVKARLNFITIYTLAFLNMGVGYVLIGLASQLPMVLLGLAIAGVGLGLLMPNMNLCLTSAVPSAVRGRVLSGITTFLFLGQFLSPLASQPLSQIVGLAWVYVAAGGVMLVFTGIAAVVVTKWR